MNETQCKILKLAPPSSSTSFNDKGEVKEPIYFHECLFCTSAKASSWLETNTPFTTIENGFLAVNDTYECINHPGVFAVGDCCHLVNNPRPKGEIVIIILFHLLSVYLPSLQIRLFLQSLSLIHLHVQ